MIFGFLFGTDWNRLNRLNGIFEVGYVWNRDIFVTSDQSMGLNLKNTFMIRVGLKF